MAPLQRWLGHPTCATSPVGSARPYRPKYSEGVIRCQSGLGEWFCTSQRGVKSLKNQLYGFVSLSCVEEVMGPKSVQQHGMLSLCLIGKSTPCEHVALHNSFAILGPKLRESQRTSRHAAQRQNIDPT